MTNTLTIIERLERGDILISDGATGTYLQAHGLEPGGCPEEFNISHPEIIRRMAREYFDAGSDLVLTNSFGGNRFMQEKYGLGDKVKEINRLAAEHAKSQTPSGCYVVGSIGPTGEFLEPLGPVTEEQMLNAFTEQACALEEGGADAVVIETLTSIEECVLAIKAAKENTKLTVMATLTYDKGPRGFFTMMGVTPQIGVTALKEAGADVIGANCGNGIDVMVELAAELRAVTNDYLLIHSNAGIPSLQNGEIIYPESPNYMVDGFLQLVDLGVNILGGCCGSNPEHIRALAKAIKN
jgi:5-methyltetrahydrofolate--homocysteine methyltransferase